MPSLSEAPSGGAKRFLVTFLGVCKKVTRCKSGTISRRYRSNGYVLDQPKTQAQIKGLELARPFIWASISSTLWPHPLGHPEHEQQQLMIRLGRDTDFGDPRHRALLPDTLHRTENLCPGLLPGSQGQGRYAQRPQQKQTSCNF
jgi:hypothetical protein